MKTLPNLTNTPPNQWRYKVPESGKIIGPYSGWIQLRENLVVYYHSAAYDMPGNIFDLVQAYICSEEPEYCGEPPKEQPPTTLGAAMKHTFHMAMQCLATLRSNRAGSGERPSLEDQERRAQICVACPQNTDIEPCSICSIKSLQGLIIKLSGAKPTSVDAQLKYCGVCHCSNKAKVATKLEAIANHMPQRQRDLLPETCWIKLEAK